MVNSNGVPFATTTPLICWGKGTISVVMPSLAVTDVNGDELAMSGDETNTLNCVPAANPAVVNVILVPRGP